MGTKLITFNLLTYFDKKYKVFQNLKNVLAVNGFHFEFN